MSYEIKNIKIGDTEYPFKKSPRAYLKFEEISGHSLDDFDSSAKDSINLLYSCFWGGGSRISFDEFLDLIDNEDITDLIGRFTKIMFSSLPDAGKKSKVR